MMKRTRFYRFLGCLVLMALLSCGDDKDDELIPENPPTPTVISNSVTTFITEGNVWSAVGYTDATLCEVHSEISDLELRCNPPEGYKVYLKKLSEKDNAGMYIYRIVCDMEPVTKVTTSNEYRIIEIPCTLSGNGYTDGVWGNKEYEKILEFNRYYAPEEQPSDLAHAWYLGEHSIVDNLAKADFQDKYTFTTNKTETRYSYDDSPFHSGYQISREEHVDEYGNLIERRQLYLIVDCAESLPGWIKAEGMFIEGKLINTRFEIPGKPEDYGCSVYSISDNKLYAMKGEYASTGELLRIHYYEFLTADRKD